MEPQTATTPQKIPLETFGRNVQSKYGGVALPDGRKIADLDPTEAGQLYIKDHPQYEPHVERRGPVQRASEGISQMVEGTPFEMPFGLGKSLAGGIAGMSSIGNEILNQTVGRGINVVTGKGNVPTQEKTPFDSQDFQEAVEPKSTTEAVGKGIGDIAQFFVPEVGIEKGLVTLPKYVRQGFQIAKDVGVAGAQTQGDEGAMTTTGVLSGALRAPGAIAQIPAVKNTLLKAFGFFSGYPKSWLEEALKRAPATVEATKEGVSHLQRMVREAFPKFRQFVGNFMKEGQQYVNKLSSSVASSGADPSKTPEGMAAAKNFVTNVINGLEKNFKIGFEPTDGKLVFNRQVNSSNIMSGPDQNTIQAAFGELKKLQNISISNIDSVYESIVSLIRKTPGGSPTGPETKKVLEGMLGELLNFTRALGSAAKGDAAGIGQQAISLRLPQEYAQYAAYKTNSLVTRTWINNIEKTFGFTTEHPNVKEEEGALTRMLQAFNENRGPTRSAAEAVGTAVGADFKGSSAGVRLNAASEPVTMRATGLSNRNALAKILEAIPRSLVRNYVKTGSLSLLSGHPVIQGVAQLLGASAADIAKEIGSMISPDSEDYSK